MTDTMREEFESWATTFFDGATLEMLKHARCPEGTEAYILEGKDNASIHLTATYLGWKAARDAAPAVHGEPVGWQCVWPGGGEFTTDSYESAKNYQKGAISSFGEDQAPFIRPIYAAPQPAGQQPDVSELVEALERIARHPRTRGDELGYAGCRNIAKEALAAHRKGAQP